MLFCFCVEDVDDNGCFESDFGGFVGQILYEFVVVFWDVLFDKVFGDQYIQGVKEVFGCLVIKVELFVFFDLWIVEVVFVFDSMIGMFFFSGFICNVYVVLVKLVVDQMFDL